MGVNDKKRRIVEAIVELHEEVGPAATTITAIAERAEVQRLTVYRHFPDNRALLAACSSHWQEGHPLPDPVTWSGIGDPRRRLGVALRELYDYFGDGSEMLTSILRDEPAMPEVGEVMSPWWEYMREVAGGLAAGWGVSGDDQRLVRSAVGHAIGFHTWRSLASESLSNEEAADLMVGLVAHAAARPLEATPFAGP
ncbi:MAG: TetR/AcrR family transcriptional regulator [Candidatus Palauibacterales bacterium]|nr:TetR/AcrR family transcriptional regulator [Candidatus Palauibacterales bacterium]MDP2482509.1 TetR/AcrR family transcriptional regulator [Candidatus Palauibacterales bacterium]